MSLTIFVITNNSIGLYGFRGELLKRLAKEHKVVISVPNDGFFEELSSLGCKIIQTDIDRRGMDPRRDLGLFLRYRKLLREVKPDLVITYTIKPNIYGGLACRLAGVPYAANITGLGTAFQKKGMLRTFVTALYQLALKKANVVFFENSGNRDTLVDLAVVRLEQCKLMNGAGVNLEHFIVSEYQYTDTIRFLFMGRVMAEKGVDELFAAMERLRSEGVDCTLDVLGYFEESYGEKIRAGEAAGWLRYHGYQKDVRPFIAASHCFVLPSWHEGMANTNLECAAMGRAVITSRIPGCMEAVVDGESGFLCEVKSVDSLCAAMRRFCNLSDDQRRAMGLAGRRHMEAVFDKQKVVDETMKGLQL